MLRTDALAGVIGAQVSKARAEADFSVEESARSALMSVEAFIAAERGDARFSASQLINLSDMFGKAPSWFFDQAHE